MLKTTASRKTRIIAVSLCILAASGCWGGAEAPVAGSEGMILIQGAQGLALKISVWQDDKQICELDGVVTAPNGYDGDNLFCPPEEPLVWGQLTKFTFTVEAKDTGQKITITDQIELRKDHGRAFGCNYSFNVQDDRKTLEYWEMTCG